MADGQPQAGLRHGATYAAFGKRSDVVSIWAPWDPAKFDVDDTAIAMVRFDNGASLLLRTSWAANIEKAYGETRILGTKGGATMSPLQIYTEAHGALVNVTPSNLPEVRAHVEEVKHFVACVRGEAACLVQTSQVLDVQAVIDAIYQSAESGREVLLNR